MSGCAWNLRRSVERDRVGYPSARLCSKMICSSLGAVLPHVSSMNTPRPSWKVPTTPHARLITPKVRLQPSLLYPEPLFLARPGHIPSAPSHSCSEPLVQLSACPINYCKAALYLPKPTPRPPQSLLHPLPRHGVSPSSQDLQQSHPGHTNMPQAPCLAAPQRQACDGHCLALQSLPEP